VVHSTTVCLDRKKSWGKVMDAKKERARQLAWWGTSTELRFSRETLRRNSVEAWKRGSTPEVSLLSSERWDKSCDGRN
jgi:hypothetical protein